MFERLFGAIEKKERSFSKNGSGVRYLAKNTLKELTESYRLQKTPQASCFKEAVNLFG